ncbi:MAG: 7-cyano-7-deazaguanine/7-aminomethyl-7-deazaguanine transporter [Cardiobacteriaceae bacterium]|nr:7-cyano-7-deazaguanine/7-aminomethyl-7-deazaguanine transporter [Cardiobacteriaceae bacterium]
MNSNNQTFAFTPAQRQKALYWLVFWHTLVIAASNILVQIPFQIGELHTTWGAFSFPFIFLTTDLTVRIFGAKMARKIIFCVMIPALVLSYLISVLFHEGQFVGFAALQTLDTFVARIAVASFIAYLVGQLLDISVFNRLRQKGKWWVAPAASTIIGNIIDTALFFSIAFYQSSDEYMAAHWQQLALTDYAWKIAVSVLFFLPAYGLLLKALTRRLTTLPAYNLGNHQPG